MLKYKSESADEKGVHCFQILRIVQNKYPCWKYIEVFFLLDGEAAAARSASRAPYAASLEGWHSLRGARR
jgi:hypothetical protein